MNKKARLRDVAMFSILVLFAGLLYPTGTVANELESNPDIKTVIDYVDL